MAVVTFMVVPIAGPQACHPWPVPTPGLPLAPTPTPRGCPRCSPPGAGPHAPLPAPGATAGCHTCPHARSPSPVHTQDPSMQHPKEPMGATHTATRATPLSPSLLGWDTATGASPPQQGRARAAAPRPVPGPRRWQSQRKLFLSLLPPHPLPFFSSPRVSNSFSSPIMRGLQGKLQQDAFVGRQSERGRQRGALCARGPPGPPGAGGTFRAITCPESNCQSFLEGKASN